MITKVELQNFKGFRAHQLPLRQLTIVVGRNNAGKSTLVEALRLVAIVVERYANLTYFDAPSWTNLPVRMRGVRPSLEGVDLELDHVFYSYGSPPAVIRAWFGNRTRVEVYVGPRSQIHGVIIDPNGQPVLNKSQARQLAIPPVGILPQIRPLAAKETVLLEEYVLQSLSSNLASIHFRNQLKFTHERFHAFTELAEQTWHGLKIVELAGKRAAHGEPLGLIVRDGNFCAEVGWMGHGLQMWLQVMWFLARVGRTHSIILDEPDVYMHADLQRKLIRTLKGKYAQTIVATHSVEIMSEVEPDSILVIDHLKGTSDFATSLPAVQRVVESMGGVHNIHLARLWNSRKCVLVEGEDMSILYHFQNKLFPASNDPFAAIPQMPIGGWGGWNYAIGSSMTLRNAFHEKIRVYCILDRDYHTQQEVDERYDQAQERGVDLHVWQKKELENYLLVPAAIHRLISGGLCAPRTAPNLEHIDTRLKQICDSLYDETLDAISNEILARDRRLGAAGANRAARVRLRDVWDNLESRLAVVSGKQVLSCLSKWSQDNYGVSISSRGLARELKTNEIDSEVVELVTAIERNQLIVKSSTRERE